MFQIFQKREKLRTPMLTLSTCFYILKSKFPVEQYVKWISNFLSIVNKFNLVIYTEPKSYKYIMYLIDFGNPRIKIVFKFLDEFKSYKYKEQWINNHERSQLNLHQSVSWELNMLWNEKVFFVEETVKKGYFKTFYYGWCDIGYFRNSSNNIHTKYLDKWPNFITLLKQPFTSNVIHYARVQRDDNVYKNGLSHIRRHYKEKLLEHPSNDLLKNYFAGGFFILKRQNIHNYAHIYEEKLRYYFDNNYIIKDDQTLLVDIIANNENMFCVHDIFEAHFDEWFAFQKILY